MRRESDKFLSIYILLVNVADTCQCIGIVKVIDEWQLGMGSTLNLCTVHTPAKMVDEIKSRVYVMEVAKMEESYGTTQAIKASLSDKGFFLCLVCF